MSRTLPPVAVIEHPSGDGKPLAENDARLAAMCYGVLPGAALV